MSKMSSQESEYSEEESNIVVIDNGANIKAGFSMEDLPRAVFKCLAVKEPKKADVANDIDKKDAYVFGEEARSYRKAYRQSNPDTYLKLLCPMSHGIITCWDTMEEIWHHTFFDKLRILPEDHPVFLTEAPLNPKACREKTTQIMFETFQVPAFYLGIDAVMSLYSSGRTTGVTLDSGQDVSHAVPVYQGYTLPHTIYRMDFAGADLTYWLQRRVSIHDLETARKLKETKSLFYVALDKEDILSEKTVTLPDGQVFSLHEERFKCPENLFDPLLRQGYTMGIHNITYDSIMKCDKEVQQDMFMNICLAGGSTLFQNLDKRMHKEISALAHARADANQKVKIVAAPERKYSVWLGGSILTSLTTFQDMWITKDEYEEFGTAIVHRKCF